MRFTLWCCFEPETGDIHRFHIAHHVQREFHPRWNLTAANTSNTNESKQEPMALACEEDCTAGQSWELYSKTAWRISISAGSFVSSYIESKTAWVAAYDLLLGPWSHCTTFSHHLIRLKDSHLAIWHSSQLIQYRMKWVVWGDTTNDYWLHTKDSNQLPSSNN